MWRAVTDEVGTAARDSLWDYPDLMPGSGDIDDPQGLITRLKARASGDAPPRDAMDDAIDALLAEAAQGGSDDDGTRSEPEDPRPV